MNIRPVSLLLSCPAMSTRAVRSTLIIATCLTLLCACRPAAAPTRGDPVLADTAFFGPSISGTVRETRAYLDKELEKSAGAMPAAAAGAATADLSLTADFPLPAGMSPKFSDIAGKYGQPDRSESKSTKDGGLTVYYYGDIGLGVSGPAETGTVTRIYVRRTLMLKH